MGLTTLSHHSCRSSTMHTPRHIWTKMGSVGYSHYQTTCSHTKQKEAARRQPTAQIDEFPSVWIDFDLTWRERVEIWDELWNYQTSCSLTKQKGASRRQPITQTDEVSQCIDWFWFDWTRKGSDLRRYMKCVFAYDRVLMWPCVVNWALVSSY